MTDHTAELEAAALESALADAHLPSLAAAMVHLTGDASFITKANWPVYDFFGDSKLGGYSAEMQAKIRDAAREALEAHLAGAPLPPPPTPRRCGRMMDFVAGVDIPEHYAPFLMEELAMPGDDPKRPDWSAPKLKAAAPRLPVVVIGRRHVGPPHRHPAQAGRHPLHHRREERRRGRHLVREPVSRTAGSTTPTTSIPTRSSPTTTGRTTSRRSRCCSPTSRASPTSTVCARTSASRRRSRRRRSDEAAAIWRVEVKDKRRHARDADRQCGDPGGRASSTSRAIRTSGHRRLRGPGVPLGALAPRRRPDRQARGGDRHRRQRLPVRAGGRPRSPSTSTSSSARRRGWRRRPTTTSRRAGGGKTGSSSTCPSTASGTGSGCSGC